MEVKYLHVEDGKVTLSRYLIKRCVAYDSNLSTVLKVYLSALQMQVRPLNICLSQSQGTYICACKLESLQSLHWKTLHIDKWFILPAELTAEVKTIKRNTQMKLSHIMYHIRNSIYN